MVARGMFLQRMRKCSRLLVARCGAGLNALACGRSQNKHKRQSMSSCIEAWVFFTGFETTYYSLQIATLSPPLAAAMSAGGSVIVRRNLRDAGDTFATTSHRCSSTSCGFLDFWCRLCSAVLSPALLERLLRMRKKSLQSPRLRLPWSTHMLLQTHSMRTQCPFQRRIHQENKTKKERTTKDSSRRMDSLFE